MRVNGLFLAFICLAWPAIAATFGTVVTRPEGFSDIVLDEARRRIYLVNMSSDTLDMYSTAEGTPRRGAAIRVGAQPVSAAASRDGRRLYVVSYGASSLSVLDIERPLPAVIATIPLAAKPQAVAVGFDERVLISTIGTGTGQGVLTVYNPSGGPTNNPTAVVIAPPAPAAPAATPPNGRVFLQGRARLAASADGRLIVGVHNLANNTRTVFVYDTRSATVLRSRNLAGAAPALAIAPDGAKFMSGITLFDTESLAILAEQNIANSPFPFPGGAAGALNTQANQGGMAFTPDGGQLYSAYNVVPVQSPAARANISRLLVNDPDNLMITFGLQLPENLAGKMVFTADGRTIYALSESGFMVLPVGNVSASPLAVPDSPVIMLANDQCGVTAAQRSSAVSVRNAGSGRMNVTASLLQIQQTGGIGLGGGAIGNISILLPPQIGSVVNPSAGAANTAATSPMVRTQPNPAVNGSEVTFQFNPNAARTLGTVAPHDFLLQSAEAINIPPSVRVYQNNRNTEARGSLYTVPVGTVSAEGLVDMTLDAVRRRVYVANSGMNRVEVFDIQQKAFTSPIKAGQLPRSLALDGDTGRLYIANSGGEFIGVVDTATGETVGRIKLPPIAFNAASPRVSPAVLAWTTRGLQIMMSDGSLWKVVGDTAVPRLTGASHPVFGAARTIPGPIRTMSASPEGNYMLLLAGNGMAYIYDSNADDFVVGRQIVAAPMLGFFGPVAAGPNGSYYLANNLILNSSLTQTGSTSTDSGGTDTGPLPGAPGTQFPVRPGVTVTASRPVAAVATAGARNFVRFSVPMRTSPTQVVTDTAVAELVDVASGRSLGSMAALEEPPATVTATSRTNINGRTMAVDMAGPAAYILTTTGLSVLPLDTNAGTARDLPVIERNGIVNIGNQLPSLAPGSIFSILGTNLAADASAGDPPLPSVLGGTCVTLGNTPVPLILASGNQINGQIPPNLAAGRYAVTVRSIARQSASAPGALTLTRYAPAVLMTGGRAAIMHKDGRYVTRDAPAKRDEQLFIYATGLGVTKGGRVTAGEAAPSNPLAVTDKIQVYFGDYRYKQAEVIVEWSGLVAGKVGLYQITVRVPGFHMNGDALPVMLKIGGVSSPTTGPNAPTVAVE
jgi:uncharacterized protein (TIGR03437 family)